MRTIILEHFSLWLVTRITWDYNELKPDKIAWLKNVYLYAHVIIGLRVKWTNMWSHNYQLLFRVSDFT